MPPTAAETKKILAALAAAYPDAKCSLDFRDPYQLLVATVLSAQCTDERVNRTTPALFARCPDFAALAAVATAELEEMIKSTGFFRNKAKVLKAAAEQVGARHAGRLPADMDDLVRLPGVGRKTANVVLGNAFGVPGVVVDTHVGRLAQRIGWTSQGNPDKIEADLMAVWPRESWIMLSHRLIAHGRAVCQARRPRCGVCVIVAWCDHGKKENNP